MQTSVGPECRRNAINRVNQIDWSDSDDDNDSCETPMKTMFQRSCGSLDIGDKAFKLLMCSNKSKWVSLAPRGRRCTLRPRRSQPRRRHKPTTKTIEPTPLSPQQSDHENTPKMANVRRRIFKYTPKSKYQHSYFDENGVYWPSTAQKRRPTPAEKAAAVAQKVEKKQDTARRYVCT